MQDIDYENINKNLNFTHSTIMHPHVEFHLHEGFEVYFLISGDVNYFVEKKIYPLKYGDLMITNNQEIHKPSFQSDKLYERICLDFNPLLVQPFNSPNFDLLHCFTNRKNGEQNKITLNAKQLGEVLGLFQKIEAARKNSLEGYEILQLNYLIELLVCINRIFMNVSQESQISNIPEKLAPVFDYIDNNLEGDLALETLEKKFFIDRFYLSKLFKSSTGSNIHSYIIFKRIAKAKTLLSRGFSVTETSAMCGFNDYSNFLRMFKKIVGVSPGIYKKSS
jgi:AraC-like DNA-binding protein